MKDLLSHLLIATVLVLFSNPIGHAAESVPMGQTMEPASGPTNPPVPQGQTGDAPLGTPVPEGGIKADIFGQEGGIIHPFIMVEGRWTDNLFITDSNEKEDFITTVSPGIWIAVPANREKLLTIDTRPTAPGGLQLSRLKPDANRRFQTYAMYSPELVFYANNSKHDHFNHNAQAMFQYNLNNGLSFDLIDLFKDKEEISGDGITDTLYRYQSNLVDFITTYDPSEKITIRFDYSNYFLNYNENINQYRDRMDHVFDLYAFYKFWPKTSLFVQFAHAIIDFDREDLYDNDENRYYAGVNWAMTGKSRGRFKIGYSEKNFDNSGIKDENGFSFELQTQHNLTAKRAVQVNAFRNFNESDTPGASSFYATGIDIGLMQRFTEKWSGTLNFRFEKDQYNGIDRDEDYFRIGPAVRYKPRDWMFFDFAYYWSKTDSSQKVYDYTSHTLIIRANLSM